MSAFGAEFVVCGNFAAAFGAEFFTFLLCSALGTEFTACGDIRPATAAFNGVCGRSSLSGLLRLLRLIHNARHNSAESHSRAESYARAHKRAAVAGVSRSGF